MGVPAFFAWLVQKYPWIMRPVAEQKEQDPINPNPNGMEFDNLYLDMNGIIHPCCHPEDRPPPATEEEMYEAVFAMLDRLFSVVRPRKLLYMAIDGVAPRAKMNQQRARRFRAAQERDEKAAQMEKLREELRQEGQNLPPPKEPSWDHNVITPGTVFMDRLSEYLRYYIHSRLNSNPAWQGVSIILSDATVPGEGEHKLVKYIRLLRAEPKYEPNTTHVICGEDADLIFLSMAMHETRFFVLRDQKFLGKGQCWHCGKEDHKTDDCKSPPPEKAFQLLDVSVVRQCIKHAFKILEVAEMKLPYKFENILDDFIFMCFWVGNDFLPHLPSLDIRDGGLDILMELYSCCLPRLPSYLTTGGHVNIPAVRQFLRYFASLEDEIMERRAVKEKAKKTPQASKQCRRWATGRCEFGDNCGFRHGDYCPKERDTGDKKGKFRAKLTEFKNQKGPGEMPLPGLTSFERRLVHELCDELQLAHESRGVGGERAIWISKDADEDMDRGAGKGEVTDSKVVAQSFFARLTAKLAKEDERVFESKNDSLILGEGKTWRQDYYRIKFARYEQPTDGRSIREKAAHDYVEGLAWVFRYYFDGCASWSWYYPYHYAPFAADLAENCPDLFEFEVGTPFPPIAQLMSVLPAASAHCLPKVCGWYMSDAQSPIIDLYPKDFELDPNGIPPRRKWQWVILLPFSDQTRILDTLKLCEPQFTDDEKRRNTLGGDLLFVHSTHPVSIEMKFVLHQYCAQRDPERTDDVVNGALPAGNSGLSGQAIMPLAEWLKGPGPLGLSGISPAEMGLEVIQGAHPGYGGTVLNPDPNPNKFPIIRSSEVMVLSFALRPNVPHICDLLPGATPHPSTEQITNEQMEEQKRDHRPKASLSDLQAARRFIMHGTNNPPPSVGPVGPVPPTYGHSFAPFMLARQSMLVQQQQPGAHGNDRGYAAIPPPLLSGPRHGPWVPGSAPGAPHGYQSYGQQEGEEPDPRFAPLLQHAAPGFHPPQRLPYVPAQRPPFNRMPPPRFPAQMPPVFRGYASSNFGPHGDGGAAFPGRVTPPKRSRV